MALTSTDAWSRSRPNDHLIQVQSNLNVWDFFNQIYEADGNDYESNNEIDIPITNNHDILERNWTGRYK